MITANCMAQIIDDGKSLAIASLHLRESIDFIDVHLRTCTCSPILKNTITGMHINNNGQKWDRIIISMGRYHKNLFIKSSKKTAWQVTGIGAECVFWIQNYHIKLLKGSHSTFRRPTGVCRKQDRDK